MNILKELQDFIDSFNVDNNSDFVIDSIRIEFSKEYKLSQLKEIGKWKKVGKNSDILHKLKKRLGEDEITTVYRLMKHQVYYYNSKDAPKYRKAIMVIFGLYQYHKEPTPQHIVSKIVSILKDTSSVDIAFDSHLKPDYKLLSRYFTLKPFITNDGIITDTRYINNTGVLMLDKITMYNKKFKNKLSFECWRYEATISIPNVKDLALPLKEFWEIVNIAQEIRS